MVYEQIFTGILNGISRVKNEDFFHGHLNGDIVGTHGHLNAIYIYIYVYIWVYIYIYIYIYMYMIYGFNHDEHVATNHQFYAKQAVN